MGFKTREFIFLDFQTTGTVASRSDIVEAGWGLYRAEEAITDARFHTHLVARAEGQALSRTIQKLTGLAADYGEGEDVISPEELRERLSAFLAEHETTPILLHYAQFKVPFLLKILGEENDLSQRIVCLHKLAKILMPGLKSYSLRAVAGYLGYATQEKKRSLDHLRATAVIWQSLADELPSDPMPEDLPRFLKGYASGEERKRSLPIHDDTLRKKRLALPHRPGVYFFLDRFGHILYVGKAADLHHRVNSYFRGRKTKGSRLNEMLTRAVDFRYVEVRSELEALLRENDEIKANDPPYNRLLRVEGRELSLLRLAEFFEAPRPWTLRPFGPLSSTWMLDFLKPFLRGDELSAIIPSYRLGITPEIAREGLLRLFASYGLAVAETPSIDDWYELALRAWPLEHERLKVKQLATVEELEDEAEEETEEEESEEEASELLWTPETVEIFLRNAFLHLYRQHLRSRWYLRLSHCRIDWEFQHSPGESHRFLIEDGRVQFCEEEKDPVPSPYTTRLASFDRLVYDRIGIIYAEIKKGLKRGDRIRLHLSPRLSLDEEQLRCLVRP